METKKFAIEQAVRLVSTMNIENKTKAVFDFANDILEYLGHVPLLGEGGGNVTMPLTYPPNYPQWICPPAVSPYWTTPINNPFEVTCKTGSTEG